MGRRIGMRSSPVYNRGSLSKRQQEKALKALRNTIESCLLNYFVGTHDFGELSPKEQKIWDDENIRRRTKRLIEGAQHAAKKINKAREPSEGSGE
jgi:hypothetical protein